MKEYGYIDESGCLVSKYLENDELNTFTLNPKWKPVDDIDESKTICASGYVVVPQPYDNGERISFKYIPQIDIVSIQYKIKQLKEKLSVDDYKIIKCYEAFIMNKNFPYDFSLLSKTRDEYRKEINALEKQILDAKGYTDQH